MEINKDAPYGKRISFNNITEDDVKHLNKTLKIIRETLRGHCFHEWKKTDGKPHIYIDAAGDGVHEDQFKCTKCNRIGFFED